MRPAFLALARPLELRWWAHELVGIAEALEPSADLALTFHVLPLAFHIPSADLPLTFHDIY